jgi:hypothetical protein
MVSIAFAHRPLGVETFGEAAEPDPARRQLVDDGKDVLSVTPEPIQLPNGKDVAFTDVVQTRFKLRSASGGAADTVLGEDARSPGLAKRIELQLGILVG